MKFELLHYRGSHYKDLSRKAVLPHGIVFTHVTQFSRAVHSPWSLTARQSSGLCECASARKLE